MALFVDGPPSTIDDMTDQDAGLLEVSLNTGINLSTKLRLASQEILADLQLWLDRSQPAHESLWRQPLRTGQIVVTPPLKRWHTMHALALAYRDAYFSQLVDRYQAKWQEYARLAREARESLVATGFGFVNDPISQPSPPLLSTVPGPQGGGVFYASVAWVNGDSQEGAASDASSITVTDGNLMTVAVTGAPENAVGFRVYASASLDTMFLQNDVVLPVDAVYTYVPGQVTQGPLAGSGQKPDYVRPMPRMMLRG
jgi:hypothetical protein